MKISICFATIRCGWLQNTFKCLGRQTFPHNEWDLIIVDDVLEDRCNYILDLARKYNINVKWMKSKPNYWKNNRMLGNARNTGFIHAQGELIVFLDDYSWVGPKFLDIHWYNYIKTKKAVIGRVIAARYKDNIDEDSSLEIIGEDNRYKQIIEKGISYLPNAEFGWFYTFNASAPLDSIVKINGYDEEFDCTGEDDIDLGERLSRTGVGFTYITEEDIIVYHFQHGAPIPLKCGNCGVVLGEYHCWITQVICPNCKKILDINDINRMRSINIPNRYNDNEIHKVNKELYNTRFDGSWGLLERNKRINPWDVNKDYFNLNYARSHPDKYPFKEYRTV